MHKRSLIQHTDSLTKWGNLSVKQPLSLFRSFHFVGFWLSFSSNAAATRTGHHNRRLSNRTNLPCAASYKCDIFGRGNTKKSLALRFAIVARLATAQTSVRFSPEPAVMDGKWSVKKSVIHRALRLVRGGRLTRRYFPKKQGQQEERIYLHHHHHGHAFSGKTGQQTSIQPCTHRPQKERDGSPEKSLHSNVSNTWP